MTGLYYGTVFADGMGKVFENRYTRKRKALRELRRIAAGGSCGTALRKIWPLTTPSYHGGTLIVSGQMPMNGLRCIWKNLSGNGWHDYGYLVIGGTWIC
jgi:hypothetical protein